MADNSNTGQVDLTLLQHVFDQQQKELERLKSGNGGGTSGGMSEDWKSSVDRQLETLHQDVRNLLYGLLAAAVLLGGAGLGFYTKLSDQSADLRVEQARTAGKIDLINEKIDRLLSNKPAAN